jgi:hypothetical protein
VLEQKRGLKQCQPGLEKTAKKLFNVLAIHRADRAC